MCVEQRSSPRVLHRRRHQAGDANCRPFDRGVSLSLPVFLISSFLDRELVKKKIKYYNVPSRGAIGVASPPERINGRKQRGRGENGDNNIGVTTCYDDPKTCENIGEYPRTPATQRTWPIARQGACCPLDHARLRIASRTRETICPSKTRPTNGRRSSVAFRIIATNQTWRSRSHWLGQRRAKPPFF